MGHSVAFLYKKTSSGWPLTKGSLGRLISRGAISVDELFLEEPPRTAARDLPRGLNGEWDLPELADTGDGSAEPETETLWSEAVDCVLPPIGTVRLLKFCDEGTGDCEESGRGISSSGGVWSGGGIGRPLAAATIWNSVQLSSLSLRPRQNGAIFRSI